MLIRDSQRRNEQIMPDHDDGRHAVYVPRPPGQHPTAATVPLVSPASANTQRDWETDLLMWPADFGRVQHWRAGGAKTLRSSRSGVLSPMCQQVMEQAVSCQGPFYGR